MRRLAMIALAPALLMPATGLLTAGEDPKADAINKELKKLEGAWIVVSAELNGKKASDEQIKEFYADTRLVFKGGKASVRRKAKVVSESTFEIDPTKKPKTLDLTVTKGENKGKKSLAIYELEGDRLKACWTLFAVERERPMTFATKPDSSLLLLVYKRETK